jgi:hypothetical protein
MGKIYHVNRNQNLDGVSILASNKIDLESKTKKKQRRSQQNVKRINQQEEIMIINTYTCNVGALNNIKETLINLKGETDSQTKTVENFHQWRDHSGKKP